MRVAVVHDYLYTLGGAEKVLKAIMRILPQAELFCLFDVLSEAERSEISPKRGKTSFLQRMPMIKTRHRIYLPIMPLAVEQFDLGSYDLVISSSYAVAKGIITGPDQLHLSYVHSPMRYAWDLQHQYLRESKMETGIASWAVRILLHMLRLWDTRTASGVDGYMANSDFIARRIAKIYGRKAEVIYPPVNVPSVLQSTVKSDFFLVASRLVPYKNVGAIVAAFRELPDQQLVVVGTGPELTRLRAMAGKNVSIRGFLPDGQLRLLMRQAAAFVFAAEEDFGIAPVEAQAEGTPVIALGRGGARETIVTEGPSPTGLFFSRPEPLLIADAVRSFLASPHKFTAAACHQNAQRFSEARFEQKFRGYVDAQMKMFGQPFEPAPASLSKIASVA